MYQSRLGDVIDERDSRNQACYNVISMKTAAVYM